MARSPRRRPWIVGLVAATVLGLAAQVGARFLVQESISGDDAGFFLPLNEAISTDDWQSAESATQQETATSSSFSWLRQRLAMLDALQQAFTQTLQQHVAADLIGSNSPSQEQLLRHVGCARMREALLKQATQEFQASVSSVNADGSSGSLEVQVASSAAAANSDTYDDEGLFEEEYYEDYSTGPVISKAAYEAAMAAQAASAIDGADPDARSLRLVESADATVGSGASTEGAAGDASSVTWTDSVFGVLSDDDKYEYDDDEAAADLVYDLTYEYDDDDDVDVDTDLADSDDVLTGYDRYDFYDADEDILSIADAILEKLDLDEQEAVWADYLDQAYEYFTVYLNDDLAEAYDYPDAYYDGVEVYVEEAAPNAMEALAGLAELLVWAQMSDHAVEVMVEMDDGSGSTYSISGSVQPMARVVSFEDLGPVLVVPGEAYIDPAFAAAVFGSGGDGAGLVAAQSSLGWFREAGAEEAVRVVNRFDTQLVYPDGSINWELVTLVLLAAGLMAMLVGFVVSWLSLRRSMGCRWVYTPQRPGKGSGKGMSKGGYGVVGSPAGGRKGMEWGGDLAEPLVLRPEDCHGAVCWGAPSTVECAAEYVSPKQANDSVAMALSK